MQLLLIIVAYHFLMSLKYKSISLLWQYINNINTKADGDSSMSTFGTLPPVGLGKVKAFHTSGVPLEVFEKESAVEVNVPWVKTQSFMSGVLGDWDSFKIALYLSREMKQVFEVLVDEI